MSEPNQMKMETQSGETNLSFVDLPLENRNTTPAKEKVIPSVIYHMIGDEILNIAFIRPIINELGEVKYESQSSQLIYEHTVEILGDSFVLYTDPEGYCLYHPKWNIGGEGLTFDEARNDLVNTIRHLQESYGRCPIEELTHQAIEFREYLLSAFNV